MSRHLHRVFIGAGALVLLASGACARREAASSPRKVFPSNALVLNLSFGSEKKAFFAEAIEAFHRTSPKTGGGRPIRVDARAEGSAEPVDAILAGSSDLHVWSPASSLLVDVLNDRWAEAKGLGSGEPIVKDAPPLLLSPVVIATWEPMAKALGWPAKRLGWKDLADLALAPGGWGSLGKAPWGDFRFGHTHPLFSNSGALSLVAATYAGAGKGRGLVAEDVEKAAPFVRRLESSVVHYGRSTGFFFDKMRTRGPAYLSAAVLYENLVAESYLDGKAVSQEFPLVAIYPREGTFWADHPFAVLNLPSVTKDHREAAEALRAFLMSEPQQRLAMERFGYRPAAATVPLGAPIDAAHGLDPKEPQNLLPNPPVGVTRQILASFEAVKRPVSITFVLDVSGSMRGEALKQAKVGARTFFESIPPADRARVLFFSNRMSWASESFEALSAARTKLAQAVEEAIANGGTALYDAVLEAMKPGAGEPEGAIRAVVLLTDGEDTDSKTSLDAVLKAVASGREGGDTARAAAPPRLFTIGYGRSIDAEVLKKLAEAGGGAYFSGDPKNIRSVYAELASFF